MDFQESTGFQIGSIRVEGEEIKEIFVSLEVFEHCYSSGITASLIVIETPSNQVLSDLGIEGNELVEIEIDTPGEQSFIWKCFINKIANRIVNPNGQITYSIDLVSALIRENEQKFINRKYKKMKPRTIINNVLEVINKDAEITTETDVMKGEGLPMEFVAANFHPVKTIHYVQRHGVPTIKGGKSYVQDGNQDATASGTGGFIYTETLKGIRFGTLVEFIDGELSNSERREFRQSLSGDKTKEDDRASILSFNVVQNNDSQNQQRSGSYKSKMVSFDIDTGDYVEQTWDSESATEKQKRTSKTPTRTFNRIFNPEKDGNTCDRVGPRGDQSRQSMQQQAGSINNFTDTVCQFTLPIHPEVSVGDKIKTTIFMVDVDTASKIDNKYSGDWIVSAVGHSYSVLNAGAYTRLTCVRPTNVQSDSDSGADFSSKIKM
ncbi:hypothetical protein OAL32_00340 [Synechococcus sp. AH-551-G15]|nr:hypothetical protein [Synechococcus sp. AH-551-G15]